MCHCSRHVAPQGARGKVGARGYTGNVALDEDGCKLDYLEVAIQTISSEFCYLVRAISAPIPADLWSICCDYALGESVFYDRYTITSLGSEFLYSHIRTTFCRALWFPMLLRSENCLCVNFNPKFVVCHIWNCNHVSSTMEIGIHPFCETELDAISERDLRVKMLSSENASIRLTQFQAMIRDNMCFIDRMHPYSPEKIASVLRNHPFLCKRTPIKIIEDFSIKIHRWITESPFRYHFFSEILNPHLHHKMHVWSMVYHPNDILVFLNRCNIF